MKKTNILFIFEGKKDENKLFNKIFKLIKNEFFIKYNIITMETHIHSLYDKLKNNQFQDLLTILKENGTSSQKEQLKKFDVKDIAEIYLFFDLDPHDSLFDPEKINDLLKFFDNETENGKIYINYPMLESFYHLININDIDYRKRVIRIRDCIKYKKIVNEENFIRKKGGNLNANDIFYIIRQNVKKVNFIIYDNFDIPEFKQISKLSQNNLFKNELNKFINPSKYVSVVSSIPMFMIEYFNEVIFKKILKI
jgi:hypothetical protein